MELSRVLLMLLSSVYVAATVISEDTGESSDWLTRSIRSARRVKRTHRENRRNSIDVSSSNLVEAEAQDSCCLNGGICIMNTFCHCKKNFYGRFCEHRVRHRSCGTIRHGTWMASGCHLCHCFDGQMTCKVTTIRGCEHLSYVEGYEKDPDYMVGMDKKAEDYDKFYDEYHYPAETDSSATSGSVKQEIALLSVVISLVIASRSVIS